MPTITATKTDAAGRTVILSETAGRSRKWGCMRYVRVLRLDPEMPLSAYKRVDSPGVQLIDERCENQQRQGPRSAMYRARQEMQRVFAAA